MSFAGQLQVCHGVMSPLRHDANSSLCLYGAGIGLVGMGVGGSFVAVAVGIGVAVGGTGVFVLEGLLPTFIHKYFSL